MSRASFFSAALVLAGASSLAACTGSLFDSSAPTTQIYVLAPVPAAPAGTSAGAQDIVISEPTAAPGLMTERIAVLYPDRRLDYYSGARWGSTSTQVVQSLFVASLRNSHAFRSVTAAPAGTAATHVVDIELRDFQAEYADEKSLPSVRVSIVANVLRVSDRRLLAVVPATASVAAGENRLTAVVLAFESAAQQVAAALGRETAAALAADRDSAPGNR